MKNIRTGKSHKKCAGCDSRHSDFFCNLSAPALAAFDSIKISAVYAAESRLFTQGQPGNGVYMICSGKVKLSICSKDGKDLILRIAEQGEVLGLTAFLTGRVHEATAEPVEQCQANFVSNRDFSLFMRKFPEAAQALIKQVNKNYVRACDQIRTIALATTSSEKLARLFVSLLNGQKNGTKTGTIEMRLTHEELGSMINASRETVTRLLKEFRTFGLITVSHSIITINDIPRLSAIANEPVVPVEIER